MVVQQQAPIGRHFSIDGSPGGSAATAFRRSTSMARLMTRQLKRNHRVADLRTGALKSNLFPPVVRRSALTRAARITTRSTGDRGLPVDNIKSSTRSP